jgi:hypothetical protein
MPAVGAVAGVLFLHTVGRTFRRQLTPLARRLRYQR